MLVVIQFLNYSQTRLESLQFPVTLIAILNNLLAMIIDIALWANPKIAGQTNEGNIAGYLDRSLTRVDIKGTTQSIATLVNVRGANANLCLIKNIFMVQLQKNL